MARENPIEYYKIAASLIPTERHHKEDNAIRVIIAPVPPITNTSCVFLATHREMKCREAHHSHLFIDGKKHMVATVLLIAGFVMIKAEGTLFTVRDNG